MVLVFGSMGIPGRKTQGEKYSAEKKETNEDSTKGHLLQREHLFPAFTAP